MSGSISGFVPRDPRVDGCARLNMQSYLDFQDILVIMGLVEGFGGKLGLDASGVVTRVGASVQHVKAGDRVISTGIGALSTQRVLKAHCVARIPDSPHLDFEDAASMCLVYATAMHALVNVVQLKAGQVSTRFARTRSNPPLMSVQAC